MLRKWMGGETTRTAAVVRGVFDQDSEESNQMVLIWLTPKFSIYLLMHEEIAFIYQCRDSNMFFFISDGFNLSTIIFTTARDI